MYSKILYRKYRYDSSFVFNLAIFSSLQNFLETQEHPQGRILGLDVGDSYVGIALSDSHQIIASPLSLYKRISFQKDAGHLVGIIEKEKICIVLMGLPYNLDGSIGSQGKKTLLFAEKITHFLTIPIVFWDERFSTQAVEKMMISFDTSRKKREALVDKLSATYILQGALDYLKLALTNSSGR